MTVVDRVFVVPQIKLLKFQLKVLKIEKLVDGNNLDDQPGGEGPPSRGQFDAHPRFQNEESTEKGM